LVDQVRKYFVKQEENMMDNHVEQKEYFARMVDGFADIMEVNQQVQKRLKAS
jgi:hypothetical protein